MSIRGLRGLRKLQVVAGDLGITAGAGLAQKARADDGETDGWAWVIGVSKGKDTDLHGGVLSLSLVLSLSK